MNDPKIKKDGILLPISDAVRARNPHLFGPGAMGRLVPALAQPATGDKGQNPKVGNREKGVEVRCQFITCRHTALDDDNAIFALKPLRDSVTAFLGFLNDNDPRLTWEYGQQLTKGAEGVIVKIEIIE